MREELYSALLKALSQEGGGETCLSLVGRVEGLHFEERVRARFLKSGSPARLVVGGWVFSAEDYLTSGLRAQHVVRGITLLTQDLPPLEAAEVLSKALLEWSAGWASREASLVEVVEAISATV